MSRLSDVTTLIQALGLAALLVGCSNHAIQEAPPEATEPIAVCDEYVATYASCLTKLTGGSAPGIEDRVRALRDTLTASRDDASRRAALRATCTTSLTQLRSSCR